MKYVQQRQSCINSMDMVGPIWTGLWPILACSRFCGSFRKHLSPDDPAQNTRRDHDEPLPKVVSTASAASATSCSFATVIKKLLIPSNYVLARRVSRVIPIYPTFPITMSTSIVCDSSVEHTWTEILALIRWFDTALSHWLRKLGYVGPRFVRARSYL